MLKVNDLVQCQPNGNLKRSFIGQIEKKFMNALSWLKLLIITLKTDGKSLN